MGKAIVVYYSQTGNTKKVAQAIHKGISQTGEQCDLARLKDVEPQELTGYDLIGLGSPAIHARELPNVTAFMNHMESLDGKHAFSFCTHGVSPGFYISRTVSALISRGLIVIGWNDWFGAAWHPLLPKPYFTDGHPDEIDLKEAEDFGREMAERSRRIYQGETQLIPTLPKGKEYDEIYRPIHEVPQYFQRLLNQVEFKVNKDKCHYPKCTYCMDNCPTGAIDLSASPPIFDRGCDLCWLCEQTCPNGAIEIDYEPLAREHVPLTEGDLMRSSKLFEAKGRFRRLVPLEEIGWDTNYWTFKKPRFKIDY
jgi:flavodoxin/ferredoxin